jgi:D-arabinose 5-phosphate isomerase GutQ
MTSLLAASCINKQINALQNLHSVIETAEYKKTIAFLSQFTDYSKRIIIAGVGKNSNIATKISESMASLGIPSMPLNITHCGHGDFGFIGHNDCIIHISRSGQTEEMLQVIDYVQVIRPDVVQILIHCKKDKPASNADYELYIGTVQEGDKEGLAPTSSTTALLCMLDCISVTLSEINGFTRSDFLKYHPAGALGAMLKQEKANG